MAPLLTVACVLRSGGEYRVEHVEALWAQVGRHLTVPHRFVCLTDVDVPCERYPLIHAWPGWWAKMELFRPGLLPLPVFYIDLDTVIVGNIDDLVLGHRFTMLGDMFKPDLYYGSGLMAWGVDMSELYRRFAEAPVRYMHEARTAGNWGDQGFIGNHVAEIERFQDRHPGRVVSFKVHCRERVPAGASIVCFHGRPRPWEVELVL